uniref:K+ potassium transporter integral membrane domain-containing protein n=1 Tax=Triticum urartu TaxID=4572 RepID=A0A8R7UZF6_TRIUA
MDLELAHGAGAPRKRGDSWAAVLLLAYQSLGVAYGDVATSPLYVFKSAFAGDDITHTAGNEEIYGVLSFVFWTLTLISLLKYVCIVLRANDGGEGGTFALYSLICRHVRAGLLPGGGNSDDLMADDKDAAASRRGAVSRARTVLERYRVLQRLLLFFALLGTCMLIGDGVLTPALSGLLLHPTPSHLVQSVSWPSDAGDALPPTLFSVLRGLGARAINGEGATQICRASGDVRDTRMLVCSATLWHAQSWVYLCANRLHLASLHKHDRALQHHPLEPPCVSSPFALLHVSVSQEDPKRWLAVTGWNPSLCNRLGSYVCRSWTFLATINSGFRE